MTDAGPRIKDVAELIDIRSLLTVEEHDLQLSVRKFLDERVRPGIARNFEEARFPIEIVPELGQLGLLGMHLEGYGCAGLNATSYGLACLELEAADSALRSFVSVQGSLAMQAIWSYGSDEQKANWLPRLARRGNWLFRID